MYLFFSLCSASFSEEPLRDLRCIDRRSSKPLPMFFPANYSFRERKNLQEMHFKTEGTGSTAYIRTSKVHAATGRTTKEEMTLMSIQEGK